MPFDWNALDEEYAQTEAPATAENKDPPDGKYRARVHKAEIKESKTGNPYLKWTLIIVGGPHDGRYLFRNNQFATKQNMAWLKKDLATCGVVLEKLSDIPNRVAELLDKEVDVKKVTKGDNYNVYIDRLASGVAAAARAALSQPASPAGADGDLPF